MANPFSDDRAEFYQRLRAALVFAGLAAACAWGYAYQQGSSGLAHAFIWAPGWLLTGILTFMLAPVREGRLGGASQGASPRLQRTQNPVVSLSNKLTVSIVAAACLGFFSWLLSWGIVHEGWRDDQWTDATFLSVAGTVTLCWLLHQLTRRWYELDVDSLTVIEHRTFFGLQLSKIRSDGPIRAVAACCPSPAYPSTFTTYVITERGRAIEVGEANTNLRDHEFRASQLADQLMVSLVEPSGQAVDRVAKAISQGYQISIRADWAPVHIPEGLLQHRSELPPLD